MTKDEEDFLKQLDFSFDFSYEKDQEYKFVNPFDHKKAAEEVTLLDLLLDCNFFAE